MEIDISYKEWLIELKGKVRSSQIKASIAVNSALIEFYWDLGMMISEKESLWGDKLIEQVAQDLQREFPNVKGLSRRNLFYAMSFYKYYSEPIHCQLSENINNDLVQQLVAQIPWGHNILIFTKAENREVALFYINQTISNQWSRAMLKTQIENKLHLRQGNAINNFSQTLPNEVSSLAQQTLTAVDSLVKMPEDNPTIGLLLCREKNSIEAEFALRDIQKPIGISEYIITNNLPEELKSSLPTIEEIEKELIYDK